MDRAGGNASQMDGWFTAIVEFMKASGSIQETPATKTFVTDDYMKRVASDPKLREFAAKDK